MCEDAAMVATLSRGLPSPETKDFGDGSRRLEGIRLWKAACFLRPKELRLERESPFATGRNRNLTAAASISPIAK
jgi:hypothetical protein